MAGRSRVVCSVVCIAALVGCRGAGGKAIEPAAAEAPDTESYTSTELGPFPADLVALAVTRDGLHVAYYVPSQAGPVLYLDGREIARCMGVPDGAFALSPDGARWSGMLVTGRDTVTVYVDGQERADLIGASDFTYSANGKGLAYVAVRTTGPLLVVNGEEQPLDRLAVDGLRFAPDGESVAYIAGEGKAKHFVIGGKAQPDYEDPVPGSLRFSDDGQHYAYAAHSGDAWIVAVDGAEVARFGQIAQFPLLSRDGAHWAVAGADGNDVRLVTEAGTTPIEGNMALGSLVQSPDGAHLAYIVGSGATWTVVVDGRPDPSYTDIANARVVFSADGAHYAYTAMIGGTMQQTAGESQPRRVGARYVVVLDGQAGPEWDYVSDRTPIFSPDGKHLAWMAKRGPEVLAVLDQTEFPIGTQGASETLRISPDSAHIAYATFDDGGTHIAIDGEPGPSIETALQGGPTWVSADTAEYLALASDTLVRVRQHAPAKGLGG